MRCEPLAGSGIDFLPGASSACLPPGCFSFLSSAPVPKGSRRNLAANLAAQRGGGLALKLPLEGLVWGDSLLGGGMRGGEGVGLPVPAACLVLPLHPHSIPKQPQEVNIDLPVL